MASKIEIVNMALTHLGKKPIVSLTDNNPSASCADIFWTNALDDTFSEHRWPFANTQSLLAELDETIIGWDYVYAYPSKAAKVFYVYDEGSWNKKEANEFEVMYLPTPDNRRVIATNIAEAYCEYTYKVLDTTLWDAKFSLSFSFKLAALMAHSLTGDRTMSAQIQPLFQSSIDDAKRLSGQEKIKKPYRESSAYDAR